MTNQTTDLLIHIRAKDGDAYPVEAVLDDGSRFTGGRFKPDMDTLRDAALNPKAYGETLFYALVDGPIRRAYDRALGQAGDGTLRVQLWIDREAASLHALVWERLHHVRQGATEPLTTSAQTPFSRYIDLEHAHVEPSKERPLRMVVLIANPMGLDKYGLQPIEVSKEIRTLVDALGDLTRAGRVDVTLLPGRTSLSDNVREQIDGLGWQIAAGNATLDNVLRALDADGGAHALHGVAHGAFRRSDGTAVLFLEDEDGAVKITPDWDLKKRLGDLASPPHLVFLASCESAKHDPTNPNPFIGLGPKLVQAGVPAVIAMQDLVPVSTARELTGDFYRHLLDHGEVDRALNQARLLLYEEDSDAWAIPVLFTHLPDGDLLVADPVRTALGAMVSHPQFNPLPEGQDYIPLNVLRLSNALETLDLERLRRERTPGQEIASAFYQVFTGPDAAFIVLIGDAGMGKSLQLRRLGRLTAEDSLRSERTRAVVPVYLDLQTLRDKALVRQTDIEDLIAKALSPFWPKEESPQPLDLVKADEEPILRMLIDGSDALPDHVRRRIWQALKRFAQRRPKHQYVVAFKSAHFAPNLLPLTDVLVMQPLNPSGLTRYLTEMLDTPVALRLYGAIERHRLHDLAALPWLLVQMLEQTAAGAPPRSRVDVLAHYVEGSVAGLATDQGMRVRAHRTLDALAWQMQSTFRSSLPADEAFEIMARIRGHRAYSLEQLFTEMVAHDLLAPVGVESLAFSRDVLRAYCCARWISRRGMESGALDDIVATLGRRSRYRWWEETLTLLAGMKDAPGALLEALLQDIILGQGKVIFLAATMLRKCSGNVDPQLRNYVVGALLTRLDDQREPDVALRARAAEALGNLEAQTAVPHLIAVAAQRVRGPQDDPSYEYSTVRLAAMLALRRMLLPPYEPVAEQSEILAEILQRWVNEDVHGLKEALYRDTSEDDGGIQALAAFALGDLGTPKAVDVLIEAFLAPDQDRSLYRSVSTALTLGDPAAMTRRVVLPLIAEADGDPSDVGTRLANLIYLIGRMRISAQTALDFLERCLKECAPIQHKGLVLQSLGWMYAVDYKTTLEDVALGHFDVLRLVGPISEGTRRYLQRKALEALIYIGDGETLERLQHRTFTWDPELERAFHRTSEEIMIREKEAVRHT